MQRGSHKISANVSSAGANLIYHFEITNFPSNTLQTFHITYMLATALTKHITMDAMEATFLAHQVINCKLQ